MARKNQTNPEPIVAEVVEPDELLSSEVAITPHKPVFDGDMIERILQYSSEHGGLSAKTARALEIINSGVVPSSAIQSRPGGGGTKIQYVSHVYCTRVMNAAFGALWDYENLDWEVFNDGSVITKNQMTIHLPLYIKPDGEPVFLTRRITEAGSFEAYQKRDNNGNPILDEQGKPVYTMNTADRVASSISRGLPKAMFRAFNFGTEQLYSETEHKPTPEEVWRTLVNTGARLGLTKDEVKNIMVENGFKGAELPDRFQEAYELVYNAGKSRNLETPEF